MSINKITYSFTSLLNLMIRRFVIESSIIYHFKIISHKLIYKFSYIKLTPLTIIRFLTRFINKCILRKYVFLSICSIVNSLLINLPLYIKSKKSKSLTFYLFSLFFFVIVVGLKDFNLLNEFYYLVYDGCSITY